MRAGIYPEPDEAPSEPKSDPQSGVISTSGGAFYKLAFNLQQKTASATLLGRSSFLTYSDMMLLTTHHLPIDILVCWNKRRMEFFQIGLEDESDSEE